MGDFLTKIETFIFDIMGLILPGIIILAVIISPSYLLDLSSMSQEHVESSYILSMLTITNAILRTHFTENTNIAIILLVILAYIIGHVVKVFAIIVYDFLEVVFDHSVNRLAIYGYENLGQLTNRALKWGFGNDLSQTKTKQYLKTVFKPIRNTLDKIFSFRSDDYVRDNDLLRTECIAEINQRLGTNFPDKWYSLYKISKIITSYESIKSLSDFFLAKYNLYRSLAFIFLFSTLYYLYFFRAASSYVSHELIKIASLTPFVSLILWFTFHYKYKRYWTLCGNETLVALYYHLKKHKLNAP